MKKALLLLISILSFTCCKSSNFVITKVYDSENKSKFVRESQFDANGNLKYIKVYSFSNNNTTFFKPEYKKGLIIKLTEYHIEGQMESYTNYIYDNDGFCLQEVLFDAKNQKVMTSDYKYDSSGKVNSINYITKNDSIIETYHYNKYDLIEKSILYNSNYTMIETRKYYYDKNNLLVKKDKYDSEGNLISYTNYRHDTDIRKYTLSDLKQDYKIVNDNTNSIIKNINGTYISFQNFKLSPYESINYYLTEFKKIKFIDKENFELDISYITGTLPFQTISGSKLKGKWKVDKDILVLNYTSNNESGTITLNISNFTNSLLEGSNENNVLIQYYRIQ